MSLVSVWIGLKTHNRLGSGCLLCPWRTWVQWLCLSSLPQSLEISKIKTCYRLQRPPLNYILSQRLASYSPLQKWRVFIAGNADATLTPRIHVGVGEISELFSPNRLPLICYTELFNGLGIWTPSTWNLELSQSLSCYLHNQVPWSLKPAAWRRGAPAPPFSQISQTQQKETARKNLKCQFFFCLQRQKPIIDLKVWEGGGSVISAQKIQCSARSLLLINSGAAAALSDNFISTAPHVSDG